MKNQNVPALGSVAPPSKSCSESPEPNRSVLPDGIVSSNDPDAIDHVVADASSQSHTDLPAVVASNKPASPIERFLQDLTEKIAVFVDQHGRAHAEMRDTPNYRAVPLRSREFRHTIRKLGQAYGIRWIREAELAEILGLLQAHAEASGIVKSVWYRVAPIQGGIAVALYDTAGTVIRITAGKVEVLTRGCETLFVRTPVCQPLAMPVGPGNLDLLKKYFNVHPAAVAMLIASITYTIAHAKVPTTSYVIVVIKGGEGRGKSQLCRLLQRLIDPSLAGIQILPYKISDFAIAAQNAHVLVFDNVRGFSTAMADALCVAATGGTITKRQLYTDDDQQLIHLHAAVIMNGIPAFIDQPDLQDRCLDVEVLQLPDTKRKSEAQLMAEFEADLPSIQQGLYDLIADIFTHLPTAEVTNPLRMLEFVQWLAAIEQAKGLRPGTYQAWFAHEVVSAQRERLLDKPLAAAVLELADSAPGSAWSGTPAELLTNLNARVDPGTQRSRYWPSCAISLSKRLVPLQAALLGQGVTVEFGRGKTRSITVSAAVRNHDD